MTIAEADLLKALAEALVPPAPGDDPGLTVDELCRHCYGRVTSHTRARVSDALRRVQAAGTLRAGIRHMARLDGRGHYARAVYTIAPAP